MILSGVGSFAVCAHTGADAQTSRSSAMTFSRVRVLFVGRKRARRRVRGPVVFVGTMFFKTRESGGNGQSPPHFFKEGKTKTEERPVKASRSSSSEQLPPLTPP